MTANSLFFLLVGFVCCVAIVLAIVIVRRNSADVASEAAVMPDQRSPLWALMLIATVPLACFTTLVGGGVLAILLGRCSLWGCSPSWPLSELDFSLPVIGFGLGLCAVIFGIWWLALLPSPLPRNAVARRTIRFVVASVGTLFAVAHAVLGVG
ncbi:hypothetical protein [Micropruina sp.]|uniref:hypothetical protein n=1 Tax=Micropruina sp. TaxID=2737536 RepID=UPI0039E64852